MVLELGSVETSVARESEVCSSVVDSTICPGEQMAIDAQHAACFASRRRKARNQATMPSGVGKWPVSV